jgi:hypothetical protein
VKERRRSWTSLYVWQLTRAGERTVRAVQWLRFSRRREARHRARIRAIPWRILNVYLGRCQTVGPTRVATHMADHTTDIGGLIIADIARLTIARTTVRVSTGGGAAGRLVGNNLPKPRSKFGLPPGDTPRKPRNDVQASGRAFQFCRHIVGSEPI